MGSFLDASKLIGLILVLVMAVNVMVICGYPQRPGRSSIALSPKFQRLLEEDQSNGDLVSLVESLSKIQALGEYFSHRGRPRVKPKTKSWKNISYVSGGEKTISSLALIFALHYFKPTPLYIMDEIDAAFDFRNTSIIAFFVKELALAAQFIIVSLRNQKFETAYRLIGICKPDHQSMAMFIDPPKHVDPEHDKDTANEPRPTVTTIGRQTTGSLFSQAIPSRALYSRLTRTVTWTDFSNSFVYITFH